MQEYGPHFLLTGNVRYRNDVLRNHTVARQVWQGSDSEWTPKNCTGLNSTILHLTIKRNC
ncbi:hypothetical protein RW109_RW109_02436 [Pseudomonas aeruginosa]|nr:hypothetical protein RW109_RW109_02436 [Pseudomonas aeruginosa]